jgi:16S rRNA U516 pseudouridylate synthase RsuA-like enzyme
MIKLKVEKIEKPTRLNKFIADSNICSRREADKLIEKYLVHINDKVATLGDTVKTGDSVSINVNNNIKNINQINNNINNNSP